MRQFMLAMILLLLTQSFGLAAEEEKLKVLIIDGQNNHDWKTTTPLMKRYLQDSGRFTADVATSPPKRHNMSTFHPRFSEYDVVLSNYNGDSWSDDTKSSFESYVLGGGGFVVVHAADNAFPDWLAYNEMIGLGGWGARTEEAGPYVYFRDGEEIRDNSPGRGGNHGKQHQFVVESREPDHPIMRGLPTRWKHTKDELYDKLRGPAKEMTVLATAFADPRHKGTGRDEPILMAVQYGNGRVFHTALGHADYSMNCIGFVTTLLRGTEWAAAGKVTLPIPEDFPTETQVSPLELEQETEPKKAEMDRIPSVKSEKAN